MKRQAAAFALLVGGGVALAALSPRVLPYNMDEFVHYHPLGCAEYPLTRAYNVYREACGAYDLRLPLTRTYLPLRSYEYIGSLPVVPFFGFWTLLRDPVAARLQGVAFFVLATLLASRLLRARLGSVLAASLLFPLYPVAFLADTGPVGLPVLLLLAALLLVRAWAAGGSAGRRTAGAGLAGLACFLGVFCKPVFAWCLPGAVLFAGWELWETGAGAARALRRNLAPAAAFGLALGLPLLALGLARDGDGRLYYSVVRKGHVSLAPESVWTVERRMGSYLLDASLIAPRTVSLPSSPLDPLPAALGLAVVGWALARGRAARRRVLPWLLAAAVTLCATVLTGGAYWPHHFAFTMAYVVLAMAAALDALRSERPLAFAVFLALALLFWASVGARLPLRTESPDANQAKDRLLEFIRRDGLDRRCVLVHVSWGTYYISHLFGDPAQIVVYFKLREWIESPQHVREVASVAAREGRGVLVVSARPERLTEVPVVASVLGRPLARYRFGNWEAAEYLR